MAIADRIVSAFGIEQGCVVLLLLRDYRVPATFAKTYRNTISTSYNVDIDRGRVFAGANLAKTKRNIAEFDSLVDAAIGAEQFVWYTPVCSNDICSLMVTKPNCVGYYVTEDGFASYRDYNPQTFTGLRWVVYRCVLKPFFHRLFAVKNHFIETAHPKFKGCIATSERCFPLHKHCLQVVGSPFKAVMPAFEVDAVVSVDPLYQFISLTQAEEYYRQLGAFVAEKKQYKHVKYKMHPRFNAANNAQHRREYLELVNRYLPHAEPLDSDVVLEELLAATKADFYSCNSSVALYAAPMGCRCYNLNCLLEGTSAFEHSSIMEELTEKII